MCDTIVALPDKTAASVTLFGKNSDRERSEAQSVEVLPAVDHSAHAQVVCTYLTVPQARRTHAVLLCRPFWMWGAEMGVNEHGVAIGNEAVFARIPASQDRALLGMDLLRLALERATTADEALRVIIDLLERYGQGGNCGLRRESFYHNSFLIADPAGAHVLETVGRHWLTRPVHGVRAISNCYDIGADAVRVSEGLDALIHENGWPQDVSIDYANAIADRSCDASGQRRRARSTSLLARRAERLTTADMFAILRDHGTEPETDTHWHPHESAPRTVCMHASDSEPRGQTVGSLVAEISTLRAVHWVTGSAAPCTSIFKPVLLSVPMPSLGARLTANPDAGAHWWRHERLHHALLNGSGKDLGWVHAERDALEADFRTRVATVQNGGDLEEQARVVAECWADAMAMEERWWARLDGTRATDAREGRH